MTVTDEGLEVDASFKLSLQLGALTDEMREFNAWQRRARENTPTPFRQGNSTTIPTPTAPTAIGLGGPTPGFIWELRSITIGGLTFTTTAAGTAEVYSTALGGAQIAAVRDLTQIVDQATALPIVGGYSTGQIILQHPEKLQVVIVSGTAGQQYAAVAFWRQYPTIAYAARVQA